VVVSRFVVRYWEYCPRPLGLGAPGVTLSHTWTTSPSELVNGMRLALRCSMEMKPTNWGISGLFILSMTSACENTEFQSGDPGQIPSNTIADGTYSIASACNGLGLDVAESSVADGAKIILWPLRPEGSAVDNANQRWKFERQADDSYRISAAHSDKSIDVAAAGQADGTAITQSTWNGAVNQRWFISSDGNGKYSFTPTHDSARRLGLASVNESQGAAIASYSVDGSCAQQWSIDGGQPVATGPVVKAEFSPSSENYPNPERGFYDWSGNDFVTEYDAGSVQAAFNAGHRLLMGKVQLDNYRQSDLPDSWLQQLGASFAKVRAAGMKMVMTYSYDFSSGGQDASAQQIKRHLEQMKPVLQANADVVSHMRAGFVGAWGEWHSSKAGNSCGYNSPSDVSCATADANRIIIRDALMANIPATTQIGIRYPLDLRTWYPDPGQQKRLGIHNDCFLAGDTDTGTYEDPTLRGYAQTLTQNAAFGGETCDIGALRTSCADILKEGSEYHLSWLNVNFAPEFLNAWRANGCFDEVSRSMGYRFQLDSVSHPQQASVGESIDVDIALRNVGWARIFTARKLVVTLRNKTTGSVLTGAAGDLQTLTSQAQSSSTIRVRVAVPVGAEVGDYDVRIAAPDIFGGTAGDSRYSIRFANADNTSAGQRWDAGTASVSSGTVINVK
jgi:Domain of unknown function (DUF4832)/Domain of unknown function (DUF4874)/Ricin-type beta-trefoil lectin domain-like